GGMEGGSRLGRREASRPAVVVAQHHRNAEPFVGAFAPPQKLGRQHDMPIAEDIGPDLDLFADDSLYRKTTSIDDGVNVFDVDAVFRKVVDGPDAGAGCHGSIALAAPLTRPGGGRALMEPGAAPFGSRSRLRSR